MVNEPFVFLVCVIIKEALDRILLSTSPISLIFRLGSRLSVHSSIDCTKTTRETVNYRRSHVCVLYFSGMYMQS